MVDNRGFMVTRSYTVGVPMMHRTGEWETPCPTPRPAGVGIIVLPYPDFHQLLPRWFHLTRENKAGEHLFVLLIQSPCEQRIHVYYELPGCWEQILPHYTDESHSQLQ